MTLVEYVSKQQATLTAFTVLYSALACEVPERYAGDQFTEREWNLFLTDFSKEN